MLTMTTTTMERFWAKVDKNGPVPEYAPHLGPCWLWTAAKDKNGYGLWKPEGMKDRMWRVHRWSYEQFVGPIPEGLTIDHLCRVTNCVRPDHLEPCTMGENKRRVPFKTACPHDHEFTPENTYIWKNQRICRVCRSERMRRWWSENGEAASERRRQRIFD